MKQAIGMIETQGMIGMIEAADAMLKSSNVHLLGSSQVGGGINTVMIEGDVAAVETAIQSAKASVSLLGEKILLSGHVIPRPEITPETFVARKKEQPEITEENQIQEGKATSGETTVVAQTKENKAATKEQSKKSVEKAKMTDKKAEETAQKTAKEQPKRQEKIVKQEKKPTESATVPEKILKVVKEELKKETTTSLKQTETPVKQPESKEQLQEKFQKMKVADLRKLAKEQKGFSRPKKEIYHMSKAKLIQALIDSLIINE
ncbi:hypothetical protein IGI37_003297 [Enterococcus sp. AZ194]|uniref:BMC domain-containing protein n=1 Tax=Enterococcus sp. AZ194 TaxID=2774629 RepID=UPI003F215F23